MIPNLHSYTYTKDMKLHSLATVSKDILSGIKYIKIIPREVARTTEININDVELNIDFDDEDEIVGIEIL